MECKPMKVTVCAFQSQQTGKLHRVISDQILTSVGCWFPFAMMGGAAKEGMGLKSKGCT